MDDLSVQPDGFYPRINAALVRSGSFANQIVSLVGTFVHSNAPDGTVNFQTSDGGMISLNTEQAEVPQIGPGQPPYEVVGQAMETGQVMVSSGWGRQIVQNGIAVDSPFYCTLITFFHARSFLLPENYQRIWILNSTTRCWPPSITTPSFPSFLRRCVQLDQHLRGRIGKGARRLWEVYDNRHPIPEKIMHYYGRLHTAHRLLLNVIVDNVVMVNNEKSITLTKPRCCAAIFCHYSTQEAFFLSEAISLCCRQS
jgi:hypothetical protein